MSKNKTKESLLSYVKDNRIVKWFISNKKKGIAFSVAFVLLSAIFIYTAISSYQMNKRTELSLNGIFHNLGKFGNENIYVDDARCFGIGMVSCRLDVIKRPLFDIEDIRLKIYPTLSNEIALRFGFKLSTGKEKRDLSCKAKLSPNENKHINLSADCNFDYRDYRVNQQAEFELSKTWYEAEKSSGSDNWSEALEKMTEERVLKQVEFNSIFDIIKADFTKDSYVMVKFLNLDFYPLKEKLFLADGITELFNLFLKISNKGVAASKILNSKDLGIEINGLANVYGDGQMDKVNNDNIMRLIKDVLIAGNRVFNKYHNRAGINIEGSDVVLALNNNNLANNILMNSQIERFIKGLKFTVWTVDNKKEERKE